MTQKEKINLLKTTITFLYEKEGRSKSYISRLLELDRKALIISINEWDLTQANISYLNPSNQKFVNKYRQLIKSRLDNNISKADIAIELNVGRDYLGDMIAKDKVLDKANKDYMSRKKLIINSKKQELMDYSTPTYITKDLKNEEWKEVLGYENYYVSNMGRIKKYIKSYDSYMAIKPHINISSQRQYVKLKDNNLSIARLVGFAFINEYSERNNTIDHIDGDFINNKASNLEWVSQSENNKRAYVNGRAINKAYSKNKKFKKLIVGNKYEFKTIRAFAQFCGVSETQGHRYISGECKCKYTIKFIY